MKEQPYKDSEFGPSISVSQLSLRSMSQGQVTVRPGNCIDELFLSS